MTIIPKPGKPGRYHLIQNLSYPNVASHHGVSSVNSQVDSNLFPCTWGTFSTICTLIYSLLLGSQGATQDVAEAYRTVPLHPSQWPALVARISENPPAQTLWADSSGNWGGTGMTRQILQTDISMP